MKFDEKKSLKRKEIVNLFKGLGELIDRDELKKGSNKINVPDIAEVEVEYKEKGDTAKLEIEIKWKLDRTQPASASNKSQSEYKTNQSMREIKQSIKVSFNTLRDNIESGAIPSIKDAEDFLSLNAAFNKLAKDEAYANDMTPYIDMISRLNEAVKDNKQDEVKSLIKEIRTSKKSCHKKYRRK